MSRFFRKADDNESSDESDDENLNANEGVAASKGAAIAAVAADDSSSDEEEEKRVVRSEKEKRFEELQQSTQIIQECLKEQQWKKLNDICPKLKDQLKKSDRVLKEEFPLFLLNTLVALDDLVPQKIDTKKLNKENAKAYNQVKNFIKKNFQQYKPQIEEHRKKKDTVAVEAPAVARIEEAPSKKTQDSTPAVAAPSKVREAEKTPGPTSKFIKGGGSEDEESESEDDDKSSGGSDDDEADGKDAGTKSKGLGINRWLKKPGEKHEEEEDEEDKETKRKARVQKRAAQGRASSQSPPRTKKDVSEKEKELWTYEKVETKLKDLVAQRGKKNFDRHAQVGRLLEVHAAASATATKEINAGGNVVKYQSQLLRILVHIINARLDVLQHVSGVVWQHFQFQFHFPSVNKDLNQSDGEQRAVVKSQWGDILTTIHSVIDAMDHLRKLDPQIRFQEGEDVEPTSSEGFMNVGLSISLIACLERLDEEYKRILQQTDHRCQAYLDWLEEENKFLILCARVQRYYDSISQPANAERSDLLRIAHLHDKPGDNVVAHSPDEPQSSAELFKLLCLRVYRNGEERLRTQAVLYQVFHLALHDKFGEARDLLLMTHIQDTIHQADISTQVLFNRAMAALGLAALRKGAITDAHSCLADICASGRVKELLAQGVSTRNFRGSGTDDQRTVEQERLERMRLMPFHQHISLELLEGAHLTTAMLLEVPNIAKERAATGITADDKAAVWSSVLWRARFGKHSHHVISRPFRRLVDYFERQVFLGPPETTREVVVAGSRALLSGDWATCCRVIVDELKVWDLQPNSDALKSLLRHRIKQEGLCAWLFANSGLLTGVSLAQLSLQFDLSSADVHQIVSRMIIQDDLQGAWDASLDQSTLSLVLYQGHPSRLQSMGLILVDKLVALGESNDRLLEQQQQQAGYGHTTRDQSRDYTGNVTGGRANQTTSGTSQRYRTPYGRTHTTNATSSGGRRFTAQR